MSKNSTIIETFPPYKVVVKKGAKEYLASLLYNVKKVLIVSDAYVYSVYGEEIKKTIESSGAEVFTFLYPQGESGKSKPILDKLIILMTEINLLKSDLIIAFGGGTASDLAGFASAIFKRGIPYINLPTTLLSMADASIGGKTAIDFLGKKNILGLINQPKAVFCDTDFLSSLSLTEISSGYAEIIKCAAILDKKLFVALEKTKASLEKSILSAIKIKAKLVKNDEFDHNNRRLLNFGHTFGHAIESYSLFSLSHGQSVAIGMIIASEISYKLNLCTKKTVNRLSDLLNAYGLNVNIDSVNKEKAFSYLLADKKLENDCINFVFIKKIGKCTVKKIPIEKLKELYFGY